MKLKFFVLILTFNVMDICTASPGMMHPKYNLAQMNFLTSEGDLIKLAKELVEQRKYEMALEFYDRAIDKNLTETSYYDYRAICYSKMGSQYLDMALSEFKKTVNSGKKTKVLNATAFENFGIRLFNEKKYNEASWCYSEAIKSNNGDQETGGSSDGSYFLMRGICNLLTKNLEEAHSDLKEVLKINPSQNEVNQTHLGKALHEFGRLEETVEVAGALKILNDTQLENLGNMFKNSEKFKDAIFCYSEGIKRDSKNMELFKKRAQAHLGAQSLDLAIQDFKQRLTKDSHDTGYWYDLIETLFSHGKFKEAIEEIQGLDDVEFGWLARKFMIAEKFEDALRIYDEAIRKYGSSAQPYIRRAKFYLKVNNLNGAIEDLKKATEFEPNVRISLVTTLIEYGMFEEALQEVRLLDNANDLFDFGEMFFDRNKLNEAIVCYTEAIIKNSNRHSFFYKRGRCHSKLKNLELAIADYNASLKLSSNDHWSGVYLSDALVDIGKYNEAEVVFRKAMMRHKTPSNSEDYTYYVQRKIKNAKPRRPEYRVNNAELVKDYEKERLLQQGLQALNSISIP